MEPVDDVGRRQAGARLLVRGAPWTEPGWFDRACSWIHAELERRGIGVSGAIEQPHVRPWSTVLRVPVTGGDVYFKASAAVLGHEPAVTQALADWEPDRILPLLAADPKRGWMLMPDGGATLRGVIQQEGDVRRWEEVLPLYAQLQIDMVARRDALLDLRGLDRRSSTLPAQYLRLLADTDALLLDLPEGLTREEYSLLHSFVAHLDAMCEQLAGYRVPETLVHEDFHDGNIFVRDGSYLFFDWGECGVGHPFSSLLVTLRSIAYRFDLAPDAPELERLRDIYLEPWTTYEPRPRLLEAFELARRVGMVGRALTWHAVVSQLQPPWKEEYSDTVPGWLHEFLSAEMSASG